MSIGWSWRGVAVQAPVESGGSRGTGGPGAMSRAHDGGGPRSGPRGARLGDIGPGRTLPHLGGAGTIGVQREPCPRSAALVANLKLFVTKHPQIAAWIVLSIGMVIMLLIASRDVGLLPTQLLALVVATIALAGLCVWIISWE